MTEPSPSDKKWTCDYCTYENYPSSLKCVMCRGPKPFVSEDIYRLGAAAAAAATDININLNNNININNNDGHSTNSDSSQQWTCEKCTFINGTRDGQCHQCGNLNSNHRSGGSSASASSSRSIINASNLHEHIQPLSISNNNSADGGGATCNSSGRIGPLMIEQCARRGSAPHKWICALCTFENWARSRRCTMCGTTSSSNKSQSSSLSINKANRTMRSSSGGVCGGVEPTQPDQQRIISPKRSRVQQKQHQQKQQRDWRWLNACNGIIDGDAHAVEAYLASGGDPTRTLTANEVALLDRSSAFDVGHTLVHMAIRFQREDLLAVLLSHIEGSGSGVKRVPSYVAPDLAADIRRHFAATLRQRRNSGGGVSGGSFSCTFVTEFPTFAIPAEVEELSADVQEQLFAELLDQDAQCQLEAEPAVINWSLEVTVRLGSRLYALWNRSSGDCLLDSVMQATWGVFDRDNMLRRALADSLNQSGRMFYPRWKEYEANHASYLHYSLDESQWEVDWASLITLAGQPGTSLEQLHVFTLAHILRRPIIVYGVKFVKSFRGEALGYARFEGVYLPLLWDSSFCVRTPIALGYTRGHFSALVSLEPYSRLVEEGGRRIMLLSGGAHHHLPDDMHNSAFLPLMDRDGKLLPIHFLMEAELGREEAILRQWLDVCQTEGGVLVAQQVLTKPPLLVAQMAEEWLNHYRRLIQLSSAPYSRTIPIQDYLSDGDSDVE